MKNLHNLHLGGVSSNLSSSILRVLLLVLGFTFGSSAMMAENTPSTRTQVNLPAVAGYTLQPGNMYIVRESMTLDATSGSALNVATMRAGQQAPILYIPADVTLTVKGADAHGTTGAGAGIYVPSGAELIITGAGTLNATGGNAANGSNGENGKNPHDYTGTGAADWANWVSDLHSPYQNMDYSGAGGRGGNGGGGAGAGIGGIGGAGGQGGQGGAVADRTQSGGTTQDGRNGADGGKGGQGGSMGKVYVTGTVTVNANSGQAGSQGGQVGQQGYSFIHEGTVVLVNGYYIAGAGGGGGGGAAGAAAPKGIGAGAPGAGGGAGGGSGAFDQVVRGSFSKVDNNSCRASSGNGGKGAFSGGSPEGQRPRDTGRSGQFILNICPQVGGQGGQGGDQGDAGSADKLFVGPSAQVNDNSVTRTSDNGATAPTDMQITITFVDNEYAATTQGGSSIEKGGDVGSITAIIGEALPDAAVSHYQLTAPSKYFAGYYSSDQGMGVRIYKGLAENGKLAKAVTAVAFPKDVTLYAHFSHNQHNVQWDYTYQQIGGGSYADVASVDRVKKSRLTFYFRDGSSTSRVLTAAEVTRPSGSSPAADSHLTTTGAITLVSSGVEVLNGEHITINIPDDKLSQFTSYTFEALDNSGTTVPTNWLVYTNASTHVTTISFTGATADHCFDLQWSVTLKGLKVYPEAIFVKPMYAEPGESTYDIISQLKDNGSIHYDGVQCAWTTKPAEGAASCTYTGTYPVWQYNAESDSYKNKIGLVGFILGGQKYYMDAIPGNVHDDMISPDTYNSADNICIYNGSTASCEVKMDVEASVIPVLRLMPNGGSLAPNTHPIYVNESRANFISLSGYRAVYPGHIQTGWNTLADGLGTTFALDATNVPGASALTLYAQWKENVPPVITTQGVTYADESATVTLKVTDNVGVQSVVYVVTSDPIEDFNPKSYDWTGAEVVTSKGENLYDITINILPYAYLYVKAEDAAGNEGYAQSGKLKTDGIAPTYHIYPLRNVCNFPVEITSMDNNNVFKVEIKKNDGEWTTIENFDSEELKNKLYIEPKLPVEYEGDTQTPVVLSLRITDAAGNVATVDNFTNMYYDHKWDTEHPHTVIEKKKKEGTEPAEYEFITHTIYNCLHGCGHVWDETIIGAKPNDPNDGYKHDSEKAGDDKTHQEQGLMRDETDKLMANSGVVVAYDESAQILDFAHTVNAGLAVPGAHTVQLLDDANVGEGDDYKTLVSSSTRILDLNGHGLLVNGQPYTEGDGVTGNANVTILLRDNGSIPYTNGSKVTGSSVQYQRNLATKARSGKWQALYLPFATETTKYAVGTVSKVSTVKGSAQLVVDKQDDPTKDINANTSYFVRSDNGELDFTATEKELLPAVTPVPVPVPVGTDDGYTQLGCLTDLTCVEENKFWVLSNGGVFARAKAGSHQRPYHWVIYTPTGAQIASIAIFEEDPTAIEDLEVVVENEEPTYTVGGVRVASTAKLAPGIYVRGGKKFIVR